MSMVAASPTLLGLPREIRDEVLTAVIDACSEPPPNPSFVGERFKAEDQHRGVLLIHYPVETPRCDYTGLMYTNHQLHNEMLELFNKRLGSGNMIAELGVMVKGYQIWPTWMSFPWYAQPALKVHKHDQYDRRINVNAHLRIFSTEGFRNNDGWPRQPGSSIRDIFTLLQFFIEFGPDFGQSATTKKSKRRYFTMVPRIEPEWEDSSKVAFERQERNLYRINALSVNVEFHDIYTRATHPETTHVIFKALKELAISGFLRYRTKAIRAQARFVQDGKEVEWYNEWAVPTRPDIDTMQRWDNWGFITFSDLAYEKFRNLQYNTE